jgi:hypothetical protein
MVLIFESWMPPGRLAGLLNLLEAPGAVRLRRQVGSGDDPPAPAEAADPNVLSAPRLFDLAGRPVRECRGR